MPRLRAFPCLLWSSWLCGLLALASLLCGADAPAPRPTVAPGATKDEVIDAFGWPNGQSQAGPREILSYTQGNVILIDGRVERVDFRPNAPWQTPRPRPAAATASTARDNPADPWRTHFDAAQQEAVRRNARLLVLFTNSDGTAPNRQFRDEVAYDPEFLAAVAAEDLVLVRLDYAASVPLPEEIRALNAQLRERFGVTDLPAFVLLAPGGARLAQNVLAQFSRGGVSRQTMIAAIKGLSAAHPLPAGALQGGQVTLPSLPSAPRLETAGAITSVEDASNRKNDLSKPLRSAGWLLASSIGTGLAAMAVLVYLLRRNWRPAEKPPAPGSNTMSPMAARIAEAASGVPTTIAIERWSKSRLRGAVATIGESDGYRVDLRTVSGMIDMTFRRSGEPVLVCCLPGAEGIISQRRVRQFREAMQTEGVSAGWVVAPAGFHSDVRDYAKDHNIVLIDGHILIERLRDLPALALPKALTRSA